MVESSRRAGLVAGSTIEKTGNQCGSNSVGRVTAFQAVGRGFESRLPLRMSLAWGMFVMMKIALVQLVMHHLKPDRKLEENIKEVIPGSILTRFRGRGSPGW